MKILTVVGARPQFIKAAVVSNILRENHTEILVHTGQHYDYNMSEQFFEELDIPKPEYNLGISGGTHAMMTGRMMVEIEKVLLETNPDVVLVYGDTNSTLAAALAAAKVHIPICHVEAGCRTGSMTNPEEINRICTDHVSSKLLACTESGISNLKKEGLFDKTVLVGDPMYDAFIKYSGKCNVDDISIKLLGGETHKIPRNYYYMTCHREENTSSDKQLTQIFEAMNSLDYQVIYPVHPRSRALAQKLKEDNRYNNIILTEPVGYLESICLTNNAIKIVTDSGGLQREAFFARKKCVTVLNFVAWPEIMVANRNELADADKQDILEKLGHEQVIDEDYAPFGDGHAAHNIIECLESM